MNWKQLAIQVITAGVVLCAPGRLVRGQSCLCQKSVNRPVAAELGRTEKKQVRDPFTGQMVPTAAQARWGRAIIANIDATASGRPATDSAIGSTQKSDTAAETSSATKMSQRSSTKPTSVLPSKSGSAAGGAIGAGTGGGAGGSSGGMSGGMSGSSAGGGASGGTDWSPRTADSGSGGTGGGSSGRSSSGTLDHLAKNDSSRGSSGSDNTSDTRTPTNSNSSDSSSIPPVLTDHGIDIPVVCQPEISIPDYSPEIPEEENPAPNGGPVPGTGGGDTPVVPEPGSIILLAIAGAISGVVVIRRRRRSISAAAAT